MYRYWNAVDRRTEINLLTTSRREVVAARDRGDSRKRRKVPERWLLAAVAPDHEGTVRGRRGRRAVLVPRAPHVDDASVEGRDAHAADEVLRVRCYGHVDIRERQAPID